MKLLLVAVLLLGLVGCVGADPRPASPAGIGTDEEALLSGVGTVEAAALADELPGALLERELPAGKK